MLGLRDAVGEASEDELCHAYLTANAERLGDDLERVLAGEPVKLAPRRFADWGTPSGRIELASARAEAAGASRVARYEPDPGATRGSHWLIAAPSIATHNTTFLHSPRHVRRAGPARAFLHPDEPGARTAARVALSNELGALAFEVVLDETTPLGSVRVDGFPALESLGHPTGINTLTSPRVSDVGDGSVLYSTRVDLTWDPA